MLSILVWFISFPMSSMTEVTKDLAIAQTTSLMNSYSFDTNGDATEDLIQQWLENYDSNWIYLATIEALYQGRYKAVSIEQIMGVWTRIGKPNTHFSGDFQRVISRNLPRHLAVARNGGLVAESKAETESSALTKVTTFSNRDLSLTGAKITTSFVEMETSKSAIVETRSSRSIATFQPLPDASSFFFRLRAFATSQIDTSKTEAISQK